MENKYNFELNENDIQSIEYFRFILPKNIINKDNIEITIEFGDNKNNREETAFYVWARVDNATIKGFVKLVFLPKCEEKEESIKSIVEFLQADNEFLEIVKKFIEYCSK